MGGSLAQPTPEERAAIEQKMQVLRENIAQQQRNIALMTQELQNHPDNPDPKRLSSFFATAAGYRDPAFYQQPDYIKALIDKLEHDKILMAANAATLAQNGTNIAVAHYKIEIERSQKFIRMLRAELKKCQAQLSEQKPNEPWKQALGKWKEKAGAEIEIFQDEDGIQARFTKLGGLLLKAKCEEGDWLFANGKPTSPNGNQIKSIRGYSYPMKADCPNLEPHFKGVVTVTVDSADEITVNTQAYEYWTPKCEWSDQFVAKTDHYTRIEQTQVVK